MKMNILVNIDVDDLDKAVNFYVHALGLELVRRLFDGSVAELGGASCPVYLLEKGAGTPTARSSVRCYERHWTPVHLDFNVDDIETVRSRALSAGANAEGGIQETAWGRLAVMSDPFGHGFCLVEFNARGYDAAE